MSKLENNTASLQAVSEKINGVNNEINSQATTIAEIAELLNGKSVPAPEEPVGTCTLRIYCEETYTANQDGWNATGTGCYTGGVTRCTISNGEEQWINGYDVIYYSPFDRTYQNVKCGEIIYFFLYNTIDDASVYLDCENAVYLASYEGPEKFIRITANPGETATIRIYTKMW